MSDTGKKLSVIICTKDRAHDLKECLQSMASQSQSPDEIVIVDASGDDSSKGVADVYKGTFPIKYIHAQPGLTKQRNIGIQNAEGAVVTFLDDDVLLEPEYFKEIMDVFDSAPEVVAAGGNITNTPDFSGLKKLFNTIFMLVRQNDERGYMQKSGFPNNVAFNEIENVTETEILSGCNFSFRKEILQKQVFDEFFEGYGLGEDMEYSYRVSKGKNAKMVITPFAKLIHKLSPVARNSYRKLFEMRVVNHYYIFRKNVVNRKSDWVCFWWSTFGVFLLAVFWSTKLGSFSPMAGLYSGHRKIQRDQI